MVDGVELNRLCAQNNAEGALWRLVRVWDPDVINRWVDQERALGVLTPPMMIGHVAEVCSGAAFVVAQRLTGDRQDAILGQQGLISRMRASVQHKLQHVGGGHKILLPNGAVHSVRKG